MRDGKADFFDFAEMEKQAFVIGLSLDQFWGRADDIYTGLTLKEFSTLIDAFNDREKIKHRLIATHAAWIMNLWTKKKVTPDQLLGTKKQDAQALSKLFDAPSSKDGVNPIVEQLNRHNAKIEEKNAINVDWAGGD